MQILENSEDVIWNSRGPKGLAVQTEGFAQYIHPENIRNTREVFPNVRYFWWYHFWFCESWFHVDDLISVILLNNEGKNVEIDFFQSTIFYSLSLKRSSFCKVFPGLVFWKFDDLALVH